ncbi:hypothetical protein GF325_04450 [Candidatus Bathyarchaeota archaeon]|nr:hypothetical protein [Candidatus Bathyarchaeota archaeon]
MAVNNIEAYRCLFDQDHVPKMVIGRQREMKLVSGFLLENFSLRDNEMSDDRYGSAIMVEGLRGLGKSTMSRKVLIDLKTKHTANKANMNFFTLNCWDKDEQQLLMDFTSKLKIPMADTKPVFSSTRDAWNIIYHYLRRHTDRCYNILISNSDFIPIRFFNKLLVNLKCLGINLVFTSRVGNSFQFLEHVDMCLNLDVYSLGDLNTIVEQRYQKAFLDQDNSIPKFITDTVVEFDTSRPGPCIAILKHLYPRLRDGHGEDISLEIIQHAIRHQLPNLSYSEFELVDFMQEATISMLLFLDNITTHFMSSGNYYLNGDDLRELYNMSCETLYIEPSVDEFSNYLARMLQHHILLKSNNDPSLFFSIVPANLLKSYLDEVLK